MLTVINIGAGSVTPDISALIEQVLERASLPAPAPPEHKARLPAPPVAQKSERYAGIAFNTDGAPSHHLFLLDEKPSGKLTWSAAKSWAQGIGMSLPTRFEAALLYANLLDQFDTSEWHWTDTQYSEAYAWVQNFNDGGQGYDGKDVKFFARAVRRLPL